MVSILCIFLNSGLHFGIVRPKIKILTSFTHPQVVPNLYEFLLLNTKDILEKYGYPNRPSVPLTSIIYYILFLHTMEVNGALGLFDYPYSSRYFLLVKMCQVLQAKDCVK